MLRRLTSDHDIRQRLGKIPPKLERLYFEVYEQVVSYEGETGRGITKGSFMWLLCALEELKSSDFRCAVAASPHAYRGGFT